MNITILFAALKAAVISFASSVGAGFMAGLGVIGQGFTADERAIGSKVMTKWHDSYEALKASGASEIDAIEGASTAALNEFSADEKAEFAKEASNIIGLLDSSFKSAAGLK